MSTQLVVRAGAAGVGLAVIGGSEVAASAAMVIPAVAVGAAIVLVGYGLFRALSK